MIRQALNLPPPFSREFYFEVPAIALPFEGPAKFVQQHEVPLINRWKQRDQGRHFTEILRPHLETQSKDQTPLSDTMSYDSSLTEVLIISLTFSYVTLRNKQMQIF